MGLFRKGHKSLATSGTGGREYVGSETEREARNVSRWTYFTFCSHHLMIFEGPLRKSGVDFVSPRDFWPPAATTAASALSNTVRLEMTMKFELGQADRNCQGQPPEGFIF
jgi:hypothetical protein